jgi:enhancer of mRNA-decapping protein 4
LVGGIRRCILKMDTTKVEKVEVFAAEVPLKCPVDKFIDGAQFVVNNDGEVTLLSICQWI